VGDRARYPSSRALAPHNREPQHLQQQGGLLRHDDRGEKRAHTDDSTHVPAVRRGRAAGGLTRRRIQEPALVP